MEQVPLYLFGRGSSAVIKSVKDIIIISLIDSSPLQLG